MYFVPTFSTSCTVSIGRSSIIHQIHHSLLSIHINSHLKWNDHVTCIIAKSCRTLNHLRHALYTCPSSVKAAVYRCVVHPLLEYASPVWYLYSPGDIRKLEAVQRRAARWVCGSRWNATRQCWSRTSDSCLDQLK